MKKCFFFLLFCLGMLCQFNAGAWNNTDPGNTSPLETNCNLPAPTGITANQPTPYTVTFNWNPVVGAIGYRATLITVGSATPINNYTAGTTATFSVNPGDTCLFMVAARCPSGEYSNNFGSLSFRAAYIIAEVIVDRGACTPPNYHLFSGGPGSSYTNAELSNGAPYLVELTKDSYRQFFQFTYKVMPNGISGFEFRGFNTNIADLYGQDPFSAIYNPAPNNPGDFIYASNMLITQLGNPEITGRLAFPNTTTIHYYNQPNEIPFPVFKVYSSCIEGGGGKPQGLGSNTNPAALPGISNEEPARNLLNNIRPANPFTSDLPLIFLEYPEQALQTRLFDASGRLFLEQRIAPEEVSENHYALPTATLPPGFYFLQVEAAPGVVQIWKVVKG